MDHPQTPDHLADIPTKRWQGQMNAWRRSLHKFDPPDLASKLAQATSKNITLAPRPCVTDQDKVQEEIAQAKASGLQVAFDSMNVGKETILSNEIGKSLSAPFLAFWACSPSDE